MDRLAHWRYVRQTRPPDQVSRFQAETGLSRHLIEQAELQRGSTAGRLMGRCADVLSMEVPPSAEFGLAFQSATKGKIVPLAATLRRHGASPCRHLPPEVSVRPIIVLSLLVLGVGSTGEAQTSGSSAESGVVLLRDGEYAVAYAPEPAQDACPMPVVGVDSAVFARQKTSRARGTRAPEPAIPTARSGCVNPLLAAPPAPTAGSMLLPLPAPMQPKP